MLFVIVKVGILQYMYNVIVIVVISVLVGVVKVAGRVGWLVGRGSCNGGRCRPYEGNGLVRAGGDG